MTAPKFVEISAPRRQCGPCQLCCTVMPIAEIQKPHNKRCGHQRHRTGCAVYRKVGMPVSCRLWSCRWLNDEFTEGMKRPDRVGYVIDTVPDYVHVQLTDLDEKGTMEVVQIWVDPKRPTSYRDPELLAYLDRCLKERKQLGLVRIDTERVILLWPPSLTGEDDWIEWDHAHENMHQGEAHSAQDILDNVREARRRVDDVQK